MADVSNGSISVFGWLTLPAGIIGICDRSVRSELLPANRSRTGTAGDARFSTAAQNSTGADDRSSARGSKSKSSGSGSTFSANVVSNGSSFRTSSSSSSRSAVTCGGCGRGGGLAGN